MAEINVGVLDLMQLGIQFVKHKVTQYRLCTNETEVVSTDYGKLRGVKRKTVYDEEYYAFEGIPYAQPPVGDLRFCAPEPLVPWQGIRDCTNWKTKPLQKHFIMHRIEGSEDCLYLNVFVKNLKSEKPLPVMVWIYGGAFQIGEATRDFYSPDYFMQSQVILVTINYRLGALGFLSFADRDLGIPGNAGLKDQLMALRWVKNNIANFNGDANNITLFGESAGAASTQLMMITEKAKGLFHKAILQSGSVLSAWACTPPHNWAYRLACKLGYTGHNIDKAVYHYLSTVKAEKIVCADKRLMTKDERRQSILFEFVPVVEPYESSDSIITKPFHTMLKTAWGNEIPLIIGYTSFEGLFSYQNTKIDPYLLEELGDCEYLVPVEVKAKHNQAEIKDMALKLKQAYFGDKEPCMKETFFQYLDAVSYKYFVHGIARIARARLAYAPQSPTYLYRFDFDSPDFNHFRVLACGNSVRGVSHADDLSYLFYNLVAWTLPKSSPEYKTIERMIGMWTAFAATSDPNCAPIKPANWQPLDQNDTALKGLNINENVEFIKLPENKKLEIWNSLYTKVPLI